MTKKQQQMQKINRAIINIEKRIASTLWFPFEGGERFQLFVHSNSQLLQFIYRKGGSFELFHIYDDKGPLIINDCKGTKLIDFNDIALKIKCLKALARGIKKANALKISFYKEVENAIVNRINRALGVR